MKQKTFMQQYRKYQRLNSRLRPTLDEYVILNFGEDLARMFERYDSIVHRIGRCTIHTRINYRFHASKQPNWNDRASELNKMWFSWK